MSLTPLVAALRNDGVGELSVLVQVKAPASAQALCQRTPLSVALVLDRSGSMAGANVDAAKACVLDLVKRLAPDDRVGLVTYDHEVVTALPMVEASSALEALPSVLAAVQAGGHTNLMGGWQQGVALLQAEAGVQRLSRVLLLSDGQANAGVVNEADINAQVSAAAAAGVSTTTVGLGPGFNESLMTGMASAGQGNAWYGDRAQDLAASFDAEVSLLSHLAWRDVEIHIGSATGQWRLLNDHPVVGQHRWSLPSIPAGAEAWAVFTVPMDSAERAQFRSRQGMALHVTVTARHADGDLAVVKASLPALPVLDAAAHEALPRHELVARRLAELKAADLQRQASRAAAQGDWAQAEALLAEVEALAQDQPWVLGVVQHLKALMKSRQRLRFGKELTYAAFKMSRRLTALDDSGEFSVESEAAKPVYLQRKVDQGRA